MLGMDSCDELLIREWIAEGRLPVMRDLLGESHRLFLGEANRALPGSVWPDIASGASAGHHGYLHEQQLRLGSYEWEPVDSGRVAVEPFYGVLSRAGVRCATVDVPVSYPIEDFNGVQVIDWGAEFQLWHFDTRPRRFATQLVSTYGKHPLTNYGATALGIDNLRALHAKLRRGLEMKRRFAVDLLRGNDYEFIFFCFSELHKAGHFLWRFHDRSHAQFTEVEPRLVDSLRACYEDMDRALGSILAHLRSSDDLILCSDRGMCADYRGDHLVDETLIRLGLAAPRGKLPSPSRFRSLRAQLLCGRRARRAYQFVARTLLPGAVRAALLPLHRAAIGDTPPLDFMQTRVFRLPSVGDSYLRVNLEGREPAGTVTPGAHYEAVLAEISARFRALINPETGEPAVANVCFPAKQFPGPKSAELPDVTIVWNATAPLHAVTSQDIGLVAGRQPPGRSGNHRSEGFVLFRGPSFAAGASQTDGDARQIAPAVLQSFGIATPAHYELPAPASIMKRSPSTLAA